VRSDQTDAVTLTTRETGAVLTRGSAAPDFDLSDQNGERVRLADLAGSWVLLWWYPKAATPG
jgi:peroxiredoxin Q/BCP